MKKLRHILKKIFFLPPFWTVLLSTMFFSLVIYVLAEQKEGILAYFAYTASAYALIICCTGISRINSLAHTVRERADENALVQSVMSNPVGMKFVRDARFRTKISLYRSLFINILYIAMKMFSGIYYRSVWFIALACYYAVLAAMRLMLLVRWNKKRHKTLIEMELYRYRLCGIMLLVMNQVLVGIVAFMVRRNRGFNYHGVLIYTMAAYSFYAVIIAVVNIVKFRKRGSPIMSAAKVIDLVAAMVSVLSLTTAMLTRFGENEPPEFHRIMTACVGVCVCTIVIGMAIFMIWKSGKQIKNLRADNLQT